MHINTNGDKDKILNPHSNPTEMVVLKVVLPLVTVLGAFNLVRYNYNIFGVLCCFTNPMKLNLDNINTKLS